MTSTASSTPQSVTDLAGFVEDRALRIGYLVSKYPAVSHTFILREVQELRKLGHCIETASINPADRESSHLPPGEQKEAEATQYIKSQGAFRALRALVFLLCRRPGSFFKAFFFALRISDASARGTIMNLFYFAEAALLGTWLQRRGLSHVHVHFGNAASTVALIAAQAYPITFSLTIHGPDEFYEVTRHVLKEKMEAARFVCCIGPYTRSQLMKISYPSVWPKYRVARLGVDPKHFRPCPFRPNPDRWEILCVGRLTPAKGQLILLHALKRLLAERRNVHCRFVGDGPDRLGLEAFVARELPAESVTFEGAVNADRIRNYLRQADAFVLPSFAEGVPVALMEAMSMEVPCISTMVAGIPELIRHGVDGLLVSPSDDIELAATLGLVMDDDNLRQRLGTAGRARVIDRYNLAANVRTLAEIMTCELIKS